MLGDNRGRNAGSPAQICIVNKRMPKSASLLCDCLITLNLGEIVGTEQGHVMGLDDSNLASDWRERLAKELADKGIKITKLSTDLGKHRDYVGNVLRGKANPNLGFLVNLFKVTGIDIFSVIRDSSESTIENTVPVGTPLETRLDELVDQMEHEQIIEENQRKLDQDFEKEEGKVPTDISEIKDSKMAALAHEILADLGPKGYFVVTGLPDAPQVFSTFPEEWAAVYVAEKFASIDPALHFMNNGSGYVSWDQLRDSSEDQTVFERSAEVGLTEGSVMTAARRGKKIAVSLCHDKKELNKDEIKAVEGALNTFLVLMERPQPSLEAYELLYYFANGLTNEQVRNIYEISPRKLADIKKQAISSLNANNLEHAVAIGCRIGIL